MSIDSSASAAASPQPRIVNGRDTSAYPATGALLLYGDAAGEGLSGLCSGTLIGCRTFLTAAHCLCPDAADDAATCERMGMVDPATLRVFLQHGGVFRVARVAINPQYRFAEAGDVGVVTLAETVTGIAPSPINFVHRPAPGTVGTIVGFGTTRRRGTNNSGIKREGEVTTGQCETDIPGDAHVCWQFSGADSNTCSGDSGGPLLVDFGSGERVTGVTSGGMSTDCLAPDTGFDTDVFVYRDWITAAAGGDVGVESCDLPAVGTDLTETFGSTRILDAADDARQQFAVPDDAAWLRVTLNAQVGSGSGPASITNDFDLFVRAGAAPTATVFDCSDTNPTTFGFCELAAPRKGEWHVMVRRVRGSGSYQVTVTTFAAASTPRCTGDCDGDGIVTVDEVLTGVSIALGGTDLAACPTFDVNGTGMVTVDALVQSVAYALNECP